MMTAAWTNWVDQVVEGRFPLQRYLGGSQNGAVFLTEYGAKKRRQAAIKLIPADPEHAGLQLARWGLAAELSHPRLLQLFEKGRCRIGDTELLYLVMEHADDDLSQLLPNRPLTPQEAREMLTPTLEALAFIHGRGFVHGHLKPANIMAVNDQLKLSSDGLRRIGEPGAGDAAGDIWSLGATLVETLTQKPPVWSGTDPQELVLPPEVPPLFAGIARNCLRRDARARSTIADLAAELKGPASASRQPASPAERYLVPATVLGLVLTAGIVVVAPRLIKSRAEPQASGDAPQPSAPVPAVRQKVQPAREHRPATLPEPSRSAQLGVLHQVLPDVPPKASSTIQGRVRVNVKVRVHPSGDVVDARIDSGGSNRYFAELAQKAARQWKFSPAPDNVASNDWTLRFEFTKAGTKALATPARR